MAERECIEQENDTVTKIVKLIRRCLMSMSNIWCSNKWIGYYAVPISILPATQLLQLKMASFNWSNWNAIICCPASQTHFSIHMLNWYSTLRRNDLSPNGWTAILIILCGCFSHLCMMNGWIVRYGNKFFIDDPHYLTQFLSYLTIFLCIYMLLSSPKIQWQPKIISLIYTTRFSAAKLPMLPSSVKDRARINKTLTIHLIAPNF